MVPAFVLQSSYPRMLSARYCWSWDRLEWASVICNWPAGTAWTSEPSARSLNHLEGKVLGHRCQAIECSGQHRHSARSSRTLSDQSFLVPPHHLGPFELFCYQIAAKYSGIFYHLSSQTPPIVRGLEQRTSTLVFFLLSCSLPIALESHQDLRRLSRYSKIAGFVAHFDFFHLIIS